MKRKCEWCGIITVESALDMHHKDGNHNNNHPSNILILCATCHRETHDKQRTDPHNQKLDSFSQEEGKGPGLLLQEPIQRRDQPKVLE